MKLREDQVRLHGLLKETITLLCKNGLQFSKGFVIDALIGITTDDSSTFLVKLEETVGDVGGDDDTDTEKGASDGNSGQRSRSLRKRPSDGTTQDTPRKRQRSDDDESDNASDINGGDNDADNDVDNDVKTEEQGGQDDGDLVFVKQEQTDYDGQMQEQSQTYGTAPDGSSFDGSHDGSSAWNQSSVNDPNASGSQQVCKTAQSLLL